MPRWILFLCLATAGQAVLIGLARLVLVPAARYLQARYGVSRQGSAELVITAPLALQIVWISLIVMWIMQ